VDCENVTFELTPEILLLVKKENLCEDETEVQQTLNTIMRNTGRFLRVY
jgi:hypothetical protein